MVKTLMSLVLTSAALVAAPGVPRVTGLPVDSQPGIGEAAPKLKHVEWIQGKPVKSFRRGTVYVLDFWASWSGICRDTMTQLRSLREKHADDRVSFISVAIWPRSGMVPPELFVKQRHELMGHTVARDKNDMTVNDWKKVIDLPAFPRAVVIDRKGKIAWVGHPHANLAEVLSAVIAKDDALLDASVSAFEQMLEDTKDTREAFTKALKYAYWDRMPEYVDRLIALDPSYFGYLARYKYRALTQLDRLDDAAEYGRSLLTGALAERAWQLDMLAWSITTSSEYEEDERDLELALAAAQLANELSDGKDWSILDTLARVHYGRKESDEAIAMQKRAVELTFSHFQRTLAESILFAYVEGRKPPRNTGRLFDG
jgi:thiol-disulfide isomerase/thioredoxin